LPPLETLDERTIAQDLAEFRFSSDPNNLDFAFLNKGRSDDGDGDGDASFASHRMFVRGHLNDDDVFGGLDDGGANDDFVDGGIQDFFTGDQAPADDVPMGGPAGFAPFGVDDSEESGRIGVVGGMEPFDPRRAPNERDLVMAMNAVDDQEEMLDYFNATFMKNWAGPEHWKLRRAVKKRTLYIRTKPSLVFSSTNTP
jgi:condensin complex subunit 2